MSNLSSVTSECSSSSSLPSQQFDASTRYDGYCNSSSGVPKLQPMYHFLSVVFGLALPVILVGLVILMYVMYTRRRTRRELEGGECNLPTVVWKPRFMNYTAQDDNADDDNDINWDDEDCVMEWARNFLDDNSTATTTADGIKLPPTQKKKMSSSAITNILPRMERLGGPYGLYATVYGIQTKVVHVAHPVPARAILTGAGVVEISSLGNGTGSSDTTGSFSFSHRKSLRMLSGSTKYPAYDHFKNFSGDGVFTANGTDWKAKRASVMHCLLRNGGALESLEVEANRTADAFEREVTYVMRSSSSKSPVMDVVPMLQRSTIALIYRLISHHNVEFGPESTREHKEKVESATSGKVSPLPILREDSECCDDDDDDESEIADCSPHSKNKEDEIKALLPIYLDSVTRIRMIVLAQSRSFWYLLPRWVYKTFSPMYRDEERTMVPIRKFARLVCENAVPGSPLALLSERDSHSSGNPAGSKVSKDLLDEAITLLFAGQDTSAATLSWTLHLLSLHPDKQERVAKEVRSVLANAETKPILKSHISKMPYLDAVIKESMRLYPVAPFIVRKLTSDITIPIDEGDLATPNSNKTCSMPASTFACIWIYALHHNPKLWQRPNEFLPERWIDPELRDQDVGQKEYGAYMPFAIGPRNCLGQPLAQAVLRILLARIINRYLVVDPKYQALQKLSKVVDDVKFDPKYLRKDMQAGFTVLPSNGLKVQLVERL